LENGCGSRAGADLGGNYRRIPSDGFEYAIGDDPARIENRDPFRERHDEPHMVFDEQHRCSGALNLEHNAEPEDLNLDT
jgi:hypothetical protein